MKLLRIGLTQGDINGISYELLLKMLSAPELLELCTPILFGMPKVAAYTCQQLRLEEIPFNIVKQASEAIDGRVNLVDVSQPEDETQVEFGRQTEQSLKAEADSLMAAINAWKKNEIDLLIASPGHLDNDAHSHALCDFIRKAVGSEAPAFDWIMAGSLRTLMLHPIGATTQLGEGLASELFASDIKDIHDDLHRDFSFIRPRIAVVSNQQKLRGDIRQLQEENIDIFGPFEEKVFVEKEWASHYDAVLFLHAEEAHDAVLDKLDAVHTIGYVSHLPMVLTYPLLPVHYDIAGQGVADETPLREALYAAIDIWRSRRVYKRATSRPLEKQWVPRGRDDFKLDLTKEE